MRSLYGKLSVALLVIVLGLGVAMIAIARFAADHYVQEVTQSLNAEIAAHIAAEATLIENGVVNRAALDSLAHFVMVINPTVELYLLDANGAILGHAAPPDKVVRTRVDLTPVQRFVAGAPKLPLVGDDPRNPSRSKVFSAAAIEENGIAVGYVYAILGGEKYAALAAELGESYIIKLSAWLLLASLIVAFLVGIVVFFLLTRRLRRMGRQVQAFAASGFREPTHAPLAGQGDDELDRLGAAFDAMSEEIARQVAQLEETDRLRRELVSNVSHDLRTPLASMQGYIDTLLLKEPELTADAQRHYLQIAAKHGRQLQRLVGELFELAKLDSGSIKPKFEPFSLSELIQDVGHEFELRAADNQIKLALTYQLQDAIVQADIGLVQRVMENLLENALKYTPRGGTVQVSMLRSADRVGVTVADSGAGIDQESIPHVFDRFYRAGAANRATGMGLGLAIVKRILDLHDGSIHVESELNSGSRFTFELPIARAA